MPQKVDTLVTGGNGLIGTALKSIHPNAKYVTRRDADLTDLSQVKKLFKKYKPKNVIHLAAKVAGVKTNLDQIADMYTENIQINTNVLNVAQESKVKKLVTVLSNCVFKEKPDHPPTEKDIYIDSPFHGHLGYGYAKRMLDLQIKLLRQQYGCNFTSITPVTVLGPNDNFDLQESHVVGSLINKCYHAKKNNGSLDVWGSGKAVRQFVYSLDVARVLLEVLKNYNDPETIIVAPREGVSIKTLAETIANVMDFNGPIQFDTSRPEGESIRVLDDTKFKSLFPNFQFTPLEESLKATADWFVKNLNKAKGKN